MPQSHNKFLHFVIIFVQFEVCSRTVRAARIGALSVSIFGFDHRLMTDANGVDRQAALHIEVWVTALAPLTFWWILKSFGERRTEHDGTLTSLGHLFGL